MILSRGCIYAMRACIYLASQEEGVYLSINRISDKLDIPHHFLTKTLQKLTEFDFLESQKGPKGGIKLKKPAESIHLIDIVETVDGPDIFTECILGLPGCGNQKPCPIHDEWADVRTRLKKMLQKNTLADMAGKGKSLDLRITANKEFSWVTE